MKAAGGRYRLMKVYQVRLNEGAPLYERAGERVKSSADVMAWAGAYYREGVEPDREHLLALFLNSAHRITGIYPVGVGTLNLAVAHARETFRACLLAPGCAAVVLVHNHPSGDPSPSEEDKRLTRQFVAAGENIGVPVLDHVIVGDGRHYSFADSRAMRIDTVGG